jgi:hypothetical protein
MFLSLLLSDVPAHMRTWAFPVSGVGSVGTLTCLKQHAHTQCPQGSSIGLTSISSSLSGSSVANGSKQNGQAGSRPCKGAASGESPEASCLDSTEYMIQSTPASNKRISTPRHLFPTVEYVVSCSRSQNPTGHAPVALELEHLTTDWPQYYREHEYTTFRRIILTKHSSFGCRCGSDFGRVRLRQPIA